MWLIEYQNKASLSRACQGHRICLVPNSPPVLQDNNVWIKPCWKNPFAPARLRKNLLSIPWLLLDLLTPFFEVPSHSVDVGVHQILLRRLTREAGIFLMPNKTQVQKKFLPQKHENEFLSPFPFQTCSHSFTFFIYKWSWVVDVDIDDDSHVWGSYYKYFCDLDDK